MSGLPVDNQQATVFHVTHWKAGSQWLHKILLDLTPKRIVSPRTDEKQFLETPLMSGAVYPAVYVTREQFHSVALPNNFRKFVVMRDLRDTLISAYFSIRYSHSVEDPRLYKLRNQLSLISVEAGLLLLMDEWLPACAKIQESWVASGERFIRYEDLLSNDLGILEDVLINHCEIPVSTDRLREVIESHRFESLTGGRKSGEEDVFSHERKGIAEDWRNYFSSVVSERFEALYGDLLVRSGYAKRVSPVIKDVIVLTPEDILRGYDAVSILYPDVPPISHWRAWEYAAYKKNHISGRTLDLGCGDGRYFRLLWPEVTNVVGVDINPHVAEMARRSGIYDQVHITSAHQIPEKSDSFDHVFANCSLEHMNDLDLVLGEIFRCLKPGASLLCSVVTDRFVEWSLLPQLFAMAGYVEEGETLQKEFISYHNLVNAFTPEVWRQALLNAGLLVEQYIPIVPKFNSGAFLLMDSLWHVKRACGGEIGDVISALLSTNQNFPRGFRSMLAGLLDMETDWSDCSGAVFLARKPG